MVNKEQVGRKTNQYLLAIIAIVAIVGIVILILNAGSSSLIYMSSSDLSGEAVSIKGTQNDCHKCPDTSGEIVCGNVPCSG